MAHLTWLPKPSAAGDRGTPSDMKIGVFGVPRHPYLGIRAGGIDLPMFRTGFVQRCANEIGSNTATTYRRRHDGMGDGHDAIDERVVQHAGHTVDLDFEAMRLWVVVDLGGHETAPIERGAQE